MIPINDTIQSETLRLEQMLASRIMGVCYLDNEGRLVQYFDGDMALRDVVVDLQRERIRQLTLMDKQLLNLPEPVSYSVLAD